MTKGLTHLKNGATTNQKHKIDSQKAQRRQCKHNTEEHQQIRKGKRKRQEV